MKPLYIINIVMVIFLSSCLKSYDDTYAVINLTDKQVKIEGFAVRYSKERSLSSIYKEIIEIQANSKYSIIKGKGEDSDPRGIFEVEWIDSVNIIFHDCPLRLN